MIKFISTIILALITNFLFAQHVAYYPNGKKIPYQLTSINNMADSLKIPGVERISTAYGEVFYLELTNKPVFIIFDKKDAPEKIPLMLQKYDYGKYLYSHMYYYQLNEFMKEGKLTKPYLLNAFGKPSSEIVNEDGSSSWIFRKFNAKIDFKGDSVVKADVINYRAYDKLQLAIFDYNISGESNSIGFNISFLNLAKKTIKYVYITVTAKNPVKDKIGTKTVRAIGPIQLNDLKRYNFENTFYSNTAQFLSLDAIKIQFMDGSIRQLTWQQIKSIQYTDWEEDGKRTL